MAFTPIPIGSLAWGSPVNTAFTDQDARISDLESGGASAPTTGFLAVPYAPEHATGFSSTTSGTVYMVRVTLAAPATLSTLTLGIFTAQVTPTAGQNFAGLYDTAGTLLAVTADQSAVWNSVGEKNMAFTAPYAAPAGDYYLAFVNNAGTAMAIHRSTAATTATTDMINHGMTASNARWTTGPTAQTSLPASITMASRTLSGVAYWLGVS